MSTALESISEVSASGAIVANASLSSSSWTATNFSTEDAYDLGYTVHAPVTGASAPFARLGSVDARVDFVLPIYAGSPSGPTDTVSIGVVISNWSWQATGDEMSVALDAWPSFSAEEHLVLGTSPGSLLSSTATSSGAMFEQMAASTIAVANPGGPTSMTISAVPSVAGNASLGHLSITFSPAAGEFTALSYAASVRVLFPATVAGIPTVDLVIVAGVASLIALLTASGARRVRRRPSDLTYVEEEET